MTIKDLPKNHWMHGALAREKMRLTKQKEVPAATSNGLSAPEDDSNNPEYTRKNGKNASKKKGKGAPTTGKVGNGPAVTYNPTGGSSASAAGNPV